MTLHSGLVCLGLGILHGFWHGQVITVTLEKKEESGGGDVGGKQRWYCFEGACVKNRAGNCRLRVKMCDTSTLCIE